MRTFKTWGLALLIALSLSFDLSCTGDIGVGPGAAWCSPHADALTGEWETTREQNGFTYNSVLNIESTETPCSFDFHYQTRLSADSTLTYESKGEILVSSADELYDLTVIKLESHRSYRRNLDHHGNYIEEYGSHIYDKVEARRWGDTLYMWNAQFTRRE